MLKYFFLALLPSSFHISIRRAMGQKVSPAARIKFGTLLLCGDVEIGGGSKLGPFCIIRCKKLTVGEHSQIKPLSLMSTRQVQMGNYVHIAPLSIIHSSRSFKAAISIGDHSRIFPFCWLEPGEGISIGRHVGIGGHTLIFTHGVWPSYIDGGPVTYGPVKIHDNVWLPWRVFVLPNVEIGENAIIAANSVVNQNVQANSIAAGSPARIIKENWKPSLSKEEKEKRLKELALAFEDHLNEENIHSRIQIVTKTPSNLTPGLVLFLLDRNSLDTPPESMLSNGISTIIYADETAYISSGFSKEVDYFVNFLRRYGVRLYKRYS